MARNRYGWEKRAKELARKQKHQEKMKRRQSKSRAPDSQEAGPGVEPGTEPVVLAGDGETGKA